MGDAEFRDSSTNSAEIFIGSSADGTLGAGRCERLHGDSSQAQDAQTTSTGCHDLARRVCVGVIPVVRPTVPKADTTSN